MKKGFIFLLILAVAGVGYFGLTANKGSSKKIKSEEKKFAVLEHKPIVVLIMSYNNLKWYEKNLRSVLEQNYDNFRIIYVDDASNDGMSEKVGEWATKDKRIQYVRNSMNLGPMANLYHGVHQCQDHEIVVILDGDDWLAHDRVLSRVNEIYANPDTWVTYGSYIYYPSYKKGECSKLIPQEVISKKQLRGYPWSSSHLRTFYAGLFKQIKLQDFLLDGKFYPAACDYASMIPLLEMAGPHSHFVNEILYVNNRDNVLNEDKVYNKEQLVVPQYVRSLLPYEPTATRLFEEKTKSADLVVFSYDRPMQLFAFLESMEKYVTHLGQATVIYRSSGSDFEEGYTKVKERFPLVQFWRQGENPAQDFKPLTMKAVFESPNDYVVFAVDDIIVKDYVDLAECTKALEQTGSYGFFLRLGKNTDYSYMMDQKQDIPASVDLGSGIFAWQFGVGKYDWDYPNNVDFTVYKKEEIRPRLQKIHFKHPNDMECHWAQKADRKKTGLYYAHSKMVNIPLNLVNLSGNRNMKSFDTKELLMRFKAGLKIDIAPLHQIENKSCHMECEVAFVER